VHLQALVNGNAPLQISGSINPLTPLAYVDLKANAKGIELTNVSTYSVKYTGYPITGGKLTMDVQYLLDHQKLTAENHIVIDQLTFGDKVESKSAMNLPIRLAVAILKNPQGEIDLRLPVSGSLSDPEFSLGGIIWHALAGLIVKAASSPFNLIASAIGAGNTGENLNYVVFKPGWANLTPTAQKKLDTVAKALQARPSLRLDIIGRVDPKLDLEKLPEALLEQAVARQKVLASDQNAANVDLATVKITPDEYNKYLKRAYKAANFEKPRDLLGLAKSLPPDEMKKLMLQNTHVSEKDLKQLADERAEAVRKYLSAKVNPSRLHVAAPKLTTEGISGGDTTRAELTLQ
jgi:outer membrane protein OmpA-like peptidoglycan-associated protein